MDLSSRVRLPETLLTQKVDDELVLLDTESENYYGLDGVGAEIWQLLRKGESLEEILTILLDRYEVEEARLRRDLLDFVSQLQERRLIEIVPST